MSTGLGPIDAAPPAKHSDGIHSPIAGRSTRSDREGPVFGAA